MFKENIKKLREEAGLTQDEFAEKIFVTRTAVSKWENGKSYPSIDSLKEISDLFGVSIDNLMSDDEFQHFKGNTKRIRPSMNRQTLKSHIGIIFSDIRLIFKSDWIKCLIVGTFAIPVLSKLFLSDSITYLESFLDNPIYFVAIMLAATKIIQLKIQIELKAPPISAAVFATLLALIYYGFLLLV